MPRFASLPLLACLLLTACASRQKNHTALFIRALEMKGVEVELGGEVIQHFFSPTGKILKIDGRELQVFEFPNDASARTEMGKIASDGTPSQPLRFSWDRTPHFFFKESLVVLYLGDDPGIQKMLHEMMGPQFAGR